MSLSDFYMGLCFWSVLSTDMWIVHSCLHLPWLAEHKLFIGMLPKNVSDTELTDLFSKYGNIKDLQILRGSQQTSKGMLLWRCYFPSQPN
jgi:hypothetical protein